MDSFTPTEGVSRLISFTWHYFLEHQEFISLLNTENMLGAKFAKQSPHISSGAGAQMRLIEKLLKRGVKEGIFQPDPAGAPGGDARDAPVSRWTNGRRPDPSARPAAAAGAAMRVPSPGGRLGFSSRCASPTG